MNHEDLRDAIMGFYAYDQGSVQSGIRDDILKSRVKVLLKDMPNGGNDFLTHLVRQEFLTDEAIEFGYSLEDVVSFIDWLDYEMDISY